MAKRKQRRDQDGLFERPDSPYYWASYIDASGKRVRRSTGIRKSTEGRKEAEALLAKWRLEAHRAQHWDEQPPRLFEELMVGYLRATTDKRSHDKDIQRTRKLRRHLEGLELHDLSPATIRDYAATRRAEGVATSTVNRELALLSAAIGYANREWDWQLPNPVTGRKLKEPEGRVRWITRAEAASLIQAAAGIPKAPHLPDFIRLALNTGCRAGELLGLEWRRVDLANGLILLEGRHTKAGKRRSVPLNREARAALLARRRWAAANCPGTRWVFAKPDGSRIQSLKNSWATACDRAGIEDFRIHDLRHTCAAWLVSEGVPLSEVRDLLGHASVTMTERYAHLAPEKVRSAVTLLEGGESRSSHAVTEGDNKTGQDRS
jgi:integrase